jgi:DNA-binding protein YbaB
MNIKQLMKQAQQMQEQMQRQMAELEVEGTAGGGMVKATMSGGKELLSRCCRT